jgi:hypothetical protein
MQFPSLREEYRNRVEQYENIVMVDSRVENKNMLDILRVWRDDNNKNYQKYTDPIISGMKMAMDGKYDNYHSNIFYTVDINDLQLLIFVNLDVDGNASHGTIQISVDDYTQSSSEHIYDCEYEIYRTNEENLIKTYLFDGDSWITTFRVSTSENTVACDLEYIVNEISKREPASFPYTSFGDNSTYFIPIEYNNASDSAFAKTLMQKNEGEDWGGLIAVDEAYMLRVFTTKSMKVDVDLLRNLNTRSMNERLISYLCDKDPDVTRRYEFSNYGEVSVELPEDIKTSAKEVEDLSVVFADLCEAIDERIDMSKTNVSTD